MARNPLPAVSRRIRPVRGSTVGCIHYFCRKKITDWNVLRRLSISWQAVKGSDLYRKWLPQFCERSNNKLNPHTKLFSLTGKVPFWQIDLVWLAQNQIACEQMYTYLFNSSNKSQSFRNHFLGFTPCVGPPLSTKRISSVFTGLFILQVTFIQSAVSPPNEALFVCWFGPITKLSSYAIILPSLLRSWTIVGSIRLLGNKNVRAACFSCAIGKSTNPH